ncbi:hypothetical protein PVAP13_6NG037083 [Panicum virgatum]|uniref:C2H2-type domain-containing protein n=1 Tax=Panicum virgatum TaxID=38727 RepID=A0A8T0QU27_PANVG|nr:hypothetical protein PVAP13_6NG037083 [Panicum virgatum]
MPPLVRGARGLLQSPFFQALGGHWASHMKPRLADGVDAAAGEPPKVHGCSICGLAEFAIGQALGGHMCRRRPANAAGKGGSQCPCLPWRADTCALVACTVCVGAKHRLEYETLHGEGTFPRRAAVPCDLLIRACFLDGIWEPGKGANVGAVLTKIQQMGGVPATTTAAPAPAPCVLPLRSWQRHRWDDGSDGGLSPDRVAALLDSHGPCVGLLWVCPWYRHFDAGRDDALVYRGCGRSEDDREQSKELYGDDETGWHAVVCFGYRFCGEQMHVLVRDNHDAAANGPQRWIDVEEINMLYTLGVERLKPPMALTSG